MLLKTWKIQTNGLALKIFEKNKDIFIHHEHEAIHNSYSMKKYI